MPRVLLAVFLGLLLAAGSIPAWAGGGITVRTIESPAVSQPGPFSSRGRTVVVPRTQIEIDEGGGSPPVTAAPFEITGKVRVVIDGDTLEVGGRRVRLYGIDAPAKGENCRADGRAWPCGQDAAFALAYETAEHWLRCEGKARDAYGALVAVCYVGPYDLNAIMVRKGWALADRQASPGYASDEAAARRVRAGVWRGGGPFRPGAPSTRR